MDKYILAHDFGTSADKAVLFRTDGKIMGCRQASYPTIHKSNRMVEQDAHTWWKAFCENTKMLLKDMDPAQIVCVSFDGTGPNCLCVDEKGEPLHKAMIWQDNRAFAQAQALNELIEKEYRGSVCEKISSDRTLPKLLWLKKNAPEIYAATWKVLPCVSNYIILKLTGRAVCDYGVGRTTALLDSDKKDWNDELLELVEVDRNILPELVDRTHTAGVVSENMSEACGLCAGTPVVTGSIDNICTQIGAGILNAGDVFLCGGTSASVEGYDNNGNRIGRPTAASGGSIDWMRKNLCNIDQVVAEYHNVDVFDMIDGIIEKTPIGSNGVIFHPYLAGARSVFDNPKARGGFFGITLKTTREDLIRSVVEGVGFNLNLILNMMRKSGMVITQMPIVGGLAKGTIVRQIFADIMNVELITYDHMDAAAALGAAILGGISIGIYEDEYAVKKFLKVTSITKPVPEDHQKYAQIEPIFYEIYEQMQPVYDKIGK